MAAATRAGLIAPATLRLAFEDDDGFAFAPGTPYADRPSTFATFSRYLSPWADDARIKLKLLMADIEGGRYAVRMLFDPGVEVFPHKHSGEVHAFTFPEVTLLMQAGVLTTELIVILAVARWHDHIFRDGVPASPAG